MYSISLYRSYHTQSHVPSHSHSHQNSGNLRKMMTAKPQTRNHPTKNINIHNTNMVNMTNSNMNMSHDLPSQKIKFQSDDSQGSDISYESSVQSDDDLQMGKVDYFKQEMARFFINHPQLINENIIGNKQSGKLFDDSSDDDNDGNLHGDQWSNNVYSSQGSNLIPNSNNNNKNSNYQTNHNNHNNHNNTNDCNNTTNNIPSYWSPILLQTMHQNQNWKQQTSSCLQSLARRIALYRSKVQQQQPDVVDLVIREQHSLLKQIQGQLNARKYQNSQGRMSMNPYYNFGSYGNSANINMNNGCGSSSSVNKMNDINLLDPNGNIANLDNNGNNGNGLSIFGVEQGINQIANNGINNINGSQLNQNSNGQPVYFSWKKRRQIQMKNNKNNTRNQHSNNNTHRNYSHPVKNNNHHHNQNNNNYNHHHIHNQINNYQNYKNYHKGKQISTTNLKKIQFSSQHHHSQTNNRNNKHLTEGRINTNINHRNHLKSKSNNNGKNNYQGKSNQNMSDSQKGMFKTFNSNQLNLKSDKDDIENRKTKRNNMHIPENNDLRLSKKGISLNGMKNSADNNDLLKNTKRINIHNSNHSQTQSNSGNGQANKVPGNKISVNVKNNQIGQNNQQDLNVPVLKKTKSTSQFHNQNQMMFQSMDNQKKNISSMNSSQDQSSIPKNNLNNNFQLNKNNGHHSSHLYSSHSNHSPQLYHSTSYQSGLLHSHQYHQNHSQNQNQSHSQINNNFVNRHIPNFEPKTEAGKQLYEQIKKYHPSDELNIKKTIVSFVVRHKQAMQKDIINKNSLSQKINKIYNEDSKQLLMFHPIRKHDPNNINSVLKEKDRNSHGSSSTGFLNGASGNDCISGDETNCLLGVLKQISEGPLMKYWKLLQEKKL